MKLYAHPRSGSNWALALLAQAFEGRVVLAPATTGHWSDRSVVMAPRSSIRGGHAFYRAGLPGPRVYLYRDGRDVAVSLWRTKAFQPVGLRGVDFATFLRTPLDWKATPGRRCKPRWTIAEHWRRHLDSWLASDACFVRYERLLADPDAELARAAELLRLPLSECPTADEGVGPYPSGDYRVAKWRDVFTDADLAHFFSSVPCDHWGLYAE